MPIANNRRIERYTALATPAIETPIANERNPFFPGGQPGLRPPSPSSSMKASASVADLGASQQYQHFPAQAARIPPSHSQLHLDSHITSQPKGTHSPSGYATPNQQTQPNSLYNSPHSANKGRESSWPLEGFTDLHLSGSEPRIFPGVVSRKQRRDSIRKDSGTESDEHALMMLKKEKEASNRSVTTLDGEGLGETEMEASDAEEEMGGLE